MNALAESNEIGEHEHLYGDLPYVLSPQSVRILKMLSSLRRGEYQRSRPICLQIVASAGSGKSRLVQHYMSQVSNEREEVGSRYREAVLIEAPYDGNCRKLCRSIINSCLPDFPVTKTVEIHERTLHVLRVAGVRQVIIDEAGNILNAGRAGQQHTLALIKSICNAGITVCIATTKNMVNVLAADEQLASRFKKVELPVWSESQDFRRFLAGIEAELQLPAPSRLDSQTIIRWLTTHDCCLTSRLLEVLMGAARLALSRGEGCITLALLEETLKNGMLSSVEVVNER